ncbi:hypothetical protein ACWEO2_34370 [Nocardia sp. NPDC004278]
MSVVTTPTTPEFCNTYHHNCDDLRRMVGYLRGYHVAAGWRLVGGQECGRALGG